MDFVSYGLSPEEAYSLGDAYIQQCENCADAMTLASCSHEMYVNFIQRVHQQRTNPNLSPPIKKCKDYIELHIEEKVRIRDIASYLGYTEYYISKKFKQETGVTINNYIRFAKIERAKVLLTTTSRDIEELSDLLCFSSRAYFSEVFTQITGMSPVKFRQTNKKH